MPPPIERERGGALSGAIGLRAPTIGGVAPALKRHRRSGTVVTMSMRWWAGSEYSAEKGSAPTVMLATSASGGICVAGKPSTYIAWPPAPPPASAVAYRTIASGSFETVRS
jgi:hypothetical protein